MLTHTENFRDLVPSSLCSVKLRGQGEFRPSCFLRARCLNTQTRSFRLVVTAHTVMYGAGYIRVNKRLVCELVTLCYHRKFSPYTQSHRTEPQISAEHSLGKGCHTQGKLGCVRLAGKYGRPQDRLPHGVTGGLTFPAICSVSLKHRDSDEGRILRGYRSVCVTDCNAFI